MADQLPAEEDLGRLPTDKELARLQRTTVLYYLHETNPDNGLVRDKTDPDAPCSIAAVGLALATIPAVVERGVLIRRVQTIDHSTNVPDVQQTVLLDRRCHHAPDLARRPEEPARGDVSLAARIDRVNK